MQFTIKSQFKKQKKIQNLVPSQHSKYYLNEKQFFVL